MNLMRYLEHDKKLLIKVIAGVVLLAVAFAFYLVKEKAAEQAGEIAVVPDEAAAAVETATSAAVEEAAVIMVDVAGAVMEPSVVELTEGSRVFEAIEKAGGLTVDADLSTTNQAEILTDGQKLYIPTRYELEESRAGSPSSGLAANSSGAAQSKRININTADSQTLQQLKGVGPATAEKIISYRTENGKFKTIEDLKNVSGIGDKTFEKLKDKITV
jgi:competence protein ComEA